MYMWSIVNNFSDKKYMRVKVFLFGPLTDGYVYLVVFNT